jgi:hypothetical protein
VPRSSTLFSDPLLLSSLVDSENEILYRNTWRKSHERGREGEDERGSRKGGKGEAERERQMIGVWDGVGEYPTK